MTTDLVERINTEQHDASTTLRLNSDHLHLVVAIIEKVAVFKCTANNAHTTDLHTTSVGSQIIMRVYNIKTLSNLIIDFHALESFYIKFRRVTGSHSNTMTSSLHPVIGKGSKLSAALNHTTRHINGPFSAI